MISLQFFQDKNDNKDVLKNTIFIIAIYAAQLGGPAINVATYGIMILFALQSSDKAIKTLSILILITFLNPGIFKTSSMSGILRWLVIYSAGIRITVDALAKKNKIYTWMMYLGFYALICLVSSLLASYAKSTSIIKLVVFFSVFIFISIGYRNVKKENMECWFLAIYLMVLVVSIPLLGSRLGYYRNGSGFQSVFSQPNAFGIFLAPFVSWMIVEGFMVNRVQPGPHRLLALTGTLFMVLSQSRTSIFAVVLAFLSMSIFFMAKRKTRRINRFYKTVFIVGMMLSVYIIISFNLFPNNPGLKSITNFITKKTGRNTHNTSENNVLDSRTDVINRSIEGFRKSPFVGIGFGLSSDKSAFYSEVDKRFGVPIKGSAEKGFLFTAVLEESGMIGLTLFCVFLFRYLYPVARTKRFVYLFPILTVIFINFGEMVFFSPGGLGMFVYLMFGFFRNLAFKNVDGAYPESRCISGTLTSG